MTPSRAPRGPRAPTRRVKQATAACAFNPPRTWHLVHVSPVRVAIKYRASLAGVRHGAGALGCRVVAAIPPVVGGVRPTARLCQHRRDEDSPGRMLVTIKNAQGKAAGAGEERAPSASCSGPTRRGPTRPLQNALGCPVSVGPRGKMNLSSKGVTAWEVVTGRQGGGRTKSCNKPKLSHERY